MTAVVYESPERVIGSLEDVREVMGDIEVTVAREMTKLHEEFIHGTVSEVIAELGGRPSIRGEITLVLGAATEVKSTADPTVIAGEFRRLRDEGVRRPDAARILAEKYGLKKNDLYRILVGVTGDGE